MCIRDSLYRGHWILKNFKFPKTYFLSSNSAWYDPNWLFEILVSFVETNFSGKGLIFLKILFILFSLYVVSNLFFKISKDSFFSVLLAVFACSGFFVSSDLGPSYLSLPLICLFLAKQIKESETTESKNYLFYFCLLYTSPSPRDATLSRMPSSA